MPIKRQEDDPVYPWYDGSDYPLYDRWFRFQDDRNKGIKGEEKYIQVYSATKSPNFPKENQHFSVTVQSEGEDIQSDPRVGLPSDVDTGEFSPDLPGREIIATWDVPISRVDDKDYYSILVFDKNGMEIGHRLS